MKRRNLFCAGVYFADDTAVIIKLKKRRSKIKSVEPICLALDTGNIVNGLVKNSRATAKKLRQDLENANVSMGLAQNYIQHTCIQKKRLSHEQITYIIKSEHYDTIRQGDKTHCFYIDKLLTSNALDLAALTGFTLQQLNGLERSLITLYNKQLNKPHTLLALKIGEQFWFLLVNQGIMVFFQQSPSEDLAQACMQTCKLYEGSHQAKVTQIISNIDFTLKNKPVTYHNPLEKYKIDDRYLPAFALASTRSLNFLDWRKRQRDCRLKRQWSLSLLSAIIVLCITGFYYQHLGHKTTLLAKQKARLQSAVTVQRQLIADNNRQLSTYEHNQTLLHYLNKLATTMPNNIRLEKFSYTPQLLRLTAVTDRQEMVLKFLTEVRKLGKTKISNIKHKAPLIYIKTETSIT